MVRYESRDDRLFTVKRVTFPPVPAGTPWEVVYQRVTSVGQTPPFSVDVEAELSLARGTL